MKSVSWILVPSFAILLFGLTNAIRAQVSNAQNTESSDDNRLADAGSGVKDFASVVKARGPEWKYLGDPDALLMFLNEVADDNQLALISVDWLGCPACGTGSAYIKALAQLPQRYTDRDVRFAYVYWRDPTGFRSDLKPPVTQSYKLFLHLTAAKKQFLGGGEEVRAFTAFPTNWRPKFPQLFFVDGSRLSEKNIATLQALNRNGLLFHPEKESVRNKDKKTLECFSGDLKLSDQVIRYALAKALHANSVLLQLTNYHLYRADGDHDRDFMAAPFLKSCDCVLSQFESQTQIPETCFRFQRPH